MKKTVIIMAAFISFLGWTTLVFAQYPAAKASNQPPATKTTAKTQPVAAPAAPAKPRLVGRSIYPRSKKPVKPPVPAAATTTAPKKDEKKK